MLKHFALRPFSALHLHPVTVKSSSVSWLPLARPTSSSATAVTGDSLTHMKCYSMMSLNLEQYHSYRPKFWT